MIVWRMCVSWVDGETTPEPLDVVSNSICFRGTNVAYTCAGGTQLKYNMLLYYTITMLARRALQRVGDGREIVVDLLDASAARNSSQSIDRSIHPCRERDMYL